MDELAKVLEVNEKEDYLPFIDTLESFEEIVETCFGFTYNPTYNENFEEKIELFEKKLMLLKQNFNITIPNKCHIIFTHIKEFIFSRKFLLAIYLNK